MATSLYLSNDPSDLSGYLKLYINTRSPNASLTASSAVTNTTAGVITTTVAMTLTAGGTTATWISAPLAEAVTISTAPVVNAYGLESSGSNNALLAFALQQYTTSAQTAFLTTSSGAELTTSNARVFWVSSNGATANTKEVITSTAFSVGDRIIVAPALGAVGIMAGSGTVTMYYNGLGTGSGADTWLVLNEDLRAGDPQIGTGENAGIRGVGVSYYYDLNARLTAAQAAGLVGTNATYVMITDEAVNQKDNV